MVPCVGQANRTRCSRFAPDSAGATGAATLSARTPVMKLRVCSRLSASGPLPVPGVMASALVWKETVRLRDVAWTSAIGGRNPSGPTASTNSASASAQPWAASLGIPLAKPGQSTHFWSPRQTGHHRLHNLCPKLANFPVRAFDRLERVMVLGVEVADRPALAAEHHRFGFRPEVVIDHAVQELPVGHARRRERHILTTHQVVDRKDTTKVLQAGSPRLLFVVFCTQPEATLQVAD